ncbi:MAG TPA: hypothetical protein VH107_19935 [Lacipirellulaceae bacterium]|jgi:hypothetical protein|nr:hypothetical protein [Lacipirellulaceae bacterium]
MATTPGNVWQELFLKWPTGIPKRGLVMSILNEAIPFKSFMLKGEMLLLERTNPDPMGSRYVLLDYGAIHLVKLIDPVKEEIFTSAGFTGHFAKV